MHDENGVFDSDQQPTQMTGGDPVKLQKTESSQQIVQTTSGDPVKLQKTESSQQPVETQTYYGGQQVNGGQPGEDPQAYGGYPGEQRPYGGQNQHTQTTGYAEPVFQQQGSNTQYQQESNSTMSAESGGFGIASMICGIISLLACCLWCISVPLAVISIVLGILQICKGTGKGMAIAGIVCSAIGLFLTLLFLVWFVMIQSYDGYNDFLRELEYQSYEQYL